MYQVGSASLADGGEDDAFFFQAGLSSTDRSFSARLPQVHEHGGIAAVVPGSCWGLRLRYRRHQIQKMVSGCSPSSLPAIRPLMA